MTMNTSWSSETIDLTESDNLTLANATESDCYHPPLESVPSQYQIIFVLLYSMTALIALFGNVTVIVVELTGKESNNQLKKYLINMAVGDVIMAVLCVPFNYTSVMLGRWDFPHWLCPIAQFTQLLSVSVTSFTLTVIGIER